MSDTPTTPPDDGFTLIGTGALPGFQIFIEEDLGDGVTLLTPKDAFDAWVGGLAERKEDE